MDAEEPVVEVFPIELLFVGGCVGVGAFVGLRVLFYGFLKNSLNVFCRVWRA
jgi:hypothetical protein